MKRFKYEEDGYLVMFRFTGAAVAATLAIDHLGLTLLDHLISP